MAIRTANKRAYLYGEGQKRQEWGIHTVVVNSRQGGCPRCARYVGKVFIDDVYSGGTKADGDYPLLSEAIKGGLFHPRCKDSTSTYFEGITNIQPMTDEEMAEMERREKLEQKESYYENQAEKNRRIAEHSLDPDNKRTYAHRADVFEEKAAEVAEKLEETVANSGESGIIEKKEVSTVSEAKKVLKDKIGFDLVESSVDLIDPALLVENTNQLQMLEDKFGIIHRSTGSICAVNEQAGTIAYANRKATNPLFQNLSLCPSHYSSRKDLIDEMKHLVESGHSMPCSFVNGELSVYSVTHEYGHMLQNSLVQKRMEELGWDASNPRAFIDNSKKTKNARLKWYCNVDNTVKDENFREIIAIAKQNNPQFSLEDNISKYGKKNKAEFFAEVFANSQLSKPNELGKAMNIWLKEKGLIL